MGGDDAAGARGRVDAQQLQRLLVARQPLDVQGPPVLGPVDAGQIDVGVGAQVDLDPFTGLHVLDIELDHGVGTPGARIALLDHRGAAAGDVQARDDVDGAFVRALQSDEALVRAPPVAGVAIQLFLGDELGRGPGDQAVAVVRDRLFSARRQVQHDQILIPHEADERTLGRDLGVNLVGGGLGQATHAAVGAVGQEDVAFQRGQDVAALFVPRIFHHAARRDPHPLTPRLLGLGQFARVGDQGPRVDQLERLAARNRRGPQVQHVHVVLARPQEGQQLAVRRQADALGHRPGQRRIGEDPLDRQDRGRRRGRGRRRSGLRAGLSEGRGRSHQDRRSKKECAHDGEARGEIFRRHSFYGAAPQQIPMVESVQPS
ncbi:hypothetical protein D3C85_900220 [compost metagenome]